MANETIQTQLSHRTIRAYSDEPVSAEDFSQIIAAARATASSRILQHASIIHVTDPELKVELSKIAAQDYLADVPELLVFIVDTHRSQRILDELGSNGHGARTIDAFTEGFTDACLMAQNSVLAAESLGLGTTFFGSILNNVPEVIRLLNLPELTFPVLGVAFGHPAQQPQLKPRMSMDLRLMENSYEEPASWLETLSDYDDEMTTYYDLREANRRVDSFTHQTRVRMENPNPLRGKYVQFIREQGWDIAID
ncbi:nitroreductase family protein [Arcanobacterium haemolyticum]|nr:nitroreductase family protein [Arcanobacterium haemolyticum]